MSLSNGSQKTWISEHRYKESLPHFAYAYIEAKPIRQLGHIELPSGSVIDYRINKRGKSFALRVRAKGSVWRSFNIVRTRNAKRRRLIECPTCCSQTNIVYAIGPHRNHWHCDRCCPLPSGDARTEKLQRHIQSGNLMPLAEAFKRQGIAAIKARVAMEREGLAPRSLSVQRHTRRQHLETASQRVKGWKPSRRLRTIRSVGRLLYVDGCLIVR